MADRPAISRQFSLSTVMETIVHCGPISRASIAKQTGLSKQTISEIARRLEEDGWIRETGRTSGHVGRTAVTYEIVPDAACIATVDLGGTKVRAAIANLACDVLGEVTEPTDPRGGRNVVNQIARMCREAAAHNDIPFDRVRMAVIGVPGVPDRLNGRVILSPNIQALDTIDIDAAFASELGVDVILENDVNLAVVGEHWVGNAAGVDDVVYVGLGTGIGAGIMVGGELLRGTANAAGELGFLPFGADPFEAESLKVGALERKIGTHGICHHYERLSGRTVEVPQIFDAAANGDPHAIATLDETARYVARMVAAICAVTNPAKVVLGGSIGGRPELIGRVRDLMPGCSPFPVEVGPSGLGPLAALVGGAALGLTELHSTLFAGDISGPEVSLPAVKVLKVMEAGR